MKKSFGKISELYDEVRLDYPEELILDVIAMSNLSPKAKILEVGIGTGKATKAFAEKGYNLTALDVDKAQILVAKKNLLEFSSIEYVVCAFEDYLPRNKFDLVFAAQTFHWIKPELRHKKVHVCLKIGGYLAVFSNFPSATTKLEFEMRKLYAECPGFNKVDYATLNVLQEQLENSGFFEKVERRMYKRDIVYTREKYLGLVNSFSWISTLPELKKELLFEKVNELLGDNVSLLVPTESILLLAKNK
ncbi:MAG: class I SAM-dependent methyltransferase [Candidatus Micrarchaeota archaeon]